MIINGSYTGIGSRQIPKNASKDLVTLAYVMAFLGYRHRSGGCIGSDWSFHWGSILACQVMRSLGLQVEERQFTVAYLPWSGFNNVPNEWSVVLRESWAQELAKKYHPSWDSLTNAAKKLMQRNVH